MSSPDAGNPDRYFKLREICVIVSGECSCSADYLEAFSFDFTEQDEALKAADSVITVTVMKSNPQVR